MMTEKKQSDPKGEKVYGEKETTPYNLTEQAGESCAEVEEKEHTANLEKKAIETLSTELQKVKDQLLRALAENDNLRRRHTKESEEQHKYAITKFAKAILSVADNIERAMEAISLQSRAQEGMEDLHKGLVLTQKELVKTFDQFSIQKFPSLDEIFDPHKHQAMFEANDPEKKSGTINQVFQEGYTIHDRLLRPAFVSVVKNI